MPKAVILLSVQCGLKKEREKEGTEKEAVVCL